MKIRKIKKALLLLLKPQKLFYFLIEFYGQWLPDKLFLSLVFRKYMGYSMDINNPRTFSEKLQWMKLYDRRDEYTRMVDKYAVKDYVASIIGKDYIIPTLYVWNTPEDIEWNKLPKQCVIKTTHSGGNLGVVVCKNIDTLDKQLAIKQLKIAMKDNIYKHYREWPYKNVQPRIIVEPYIEDAETKELRDYKFFCFDGVVKALFVATERQKEGEEVKFNFFDTDFNDLKIKQGHPNAKELPKKPLNFEEMKKIAAVLSKGLPQVRVDLYEANGRVYFGEMTFFHFSGLVPFEPAEWDLTFGSWIKLPA